MKTLFLTGLLVFSTSSFAATLNDAQITQVVMTVDKGEAALGKLATETTQNSEVKNFAKHMVADHTEGKKKTDAFVSKTSLAPEESDKSKSLKKENETLKGKLMSLKGKEFDKAYISSQVDGHKKVLASLDNELIPNAKNQELKAMLEKKKDVVEGHLKHAKSIQATL